MTLTAPLLAVLLSLAADPASITALRDPVEPAAPAADLTAVDLALAPGVTLRVESARATRMREVDGRPTGLVLIGKLRLRFAPQDSMEARQLELYTRARTIDEELSEAVVWSRADLLPAGSTAAPGPAAAAAALARERLGKLLDLGADPRPAAAGAAAPGFALALLHGQGLGWFAVQHDPRAVPRVSVGRFHDDAEHLGFVTWSAEGGGEPGAPAAIERHALDVQLAQGEQVQVEDRVRLKVLEDSVRVLSFALDREMRIAGVKDGGGQELAFFQAERGDSRPLLPAALDAGQVSVFLPAEPARGSTLELVFRGAGKLLERVGKDVYFPQRQGWFPTLGYFQRSRFELSYGFPQGMQVVSVGKLVEEAPAEGGMRARYLLEQPSDVAGFAYGKFVMKEAKSGNVKVRAFGNKELPDWIGDLTAETVMVGQQNQADAESDSPMRTAPMSGHGIVAGQMEALRAMDPARMAQRLAGETAAATAFHAAHYGDYPFDRLDIAQIEGVFGQGWPGLLFVSSLAFLDWTQRNALGIERGGQSWAAHVMPSHEAAHQWWGNLVGWKTPADQWLSEGFAHYSALLFLRATEGEEAFVRELDELRDGLLAKGKGGRRLAEWGPVLAGTRLAGAEDPGAYFAVVYGKGAYILHMLRAQMMDYSKNDDSRFHRMLAKFARDHAWSNAGTADFRRAVEAELGRDMTSFFETWVRGTDLPRLTASSKQVKEGAGKYNLELRVKVEGVPPDFTMSMPVHLYQGKKVIAGRLQLKVPESVVVVPLSEKPSKVEFNAERAILCEMVK